MKKMHQLCIAAGVEAGEINEASVKTSTVEENNIVGGGASDS